ncbi:PGG domain-containing protein [Abeliophyllum distichum]|uniref:PGG domain-containing protein n=1 Tax=Abeliophyllum distichum TaxID=126358 RepID=A0ABD1NY88_9LAMI
MAGRRRRGWDEAITGDSDKTEPEPGSDDESNLFRADWRRVEVYLGFKRIYCSLQKRKQADNDKNNILQLAGKLAPQSRLNIVSGAALQMQRELLWFKEVEKILQPSEIKLKYRDKKTPRELFSDEHNGYGKLVRSG